VSSVFKKAGLGLAVLMSLLAALSTGMVLILRYQPKTPVNATRKVFGRVLNPVWMRLSDRFNLDTAVVHHVGRKSGREYATPLCMVSTPEGFIVPAACGPNTDWLANLKATAESKVTYNRATHPTIAEVIDLQQAIRYAGGTPGCDCWTQFRVKELVRLRPVTQTSGHAGGTEAQTTSEPITTAST